MVVIQHTGRNKAFEKYPPARTVWDKLYVATGTASGATLGFIIGNIPGAIVGGKLGYHAANNQIIKKYDQ